MCRVTALLPCIASIAGLFLTGIYARAGEPQVNSAAAATQTAEAQPITFDEFLARVAANNLDLAAQRYNITIAQAQVVAAKVSPNPVLATTFATDISHRDQATTWSEALTEEIEVAGRRKFRVTAAQKNLLAVSATVDDFFRQLQGTAATAFATALAGQMTVEEKRRAYEALDKLAKANEKRLSEGDIGEVDANQAKLEAKQAEGDLVAAQSTQSANLFALIQLMGKKNAPVRSPAGSLVFRERDFSLQSILSVALQNRPDVRAARFTFESAQASAKLAKANRIPDPTIGLGFTETGRITNHIDPAPSYNDLNLSVSIPLPLFNSYRGEYQAALATAAQAQVTLQSTELKAEVDVRTNFDRYRLARQQLAKYQGNAIELARKVFEAKLTSYRLGAATLLDVLQAAKDETDVRLDYIAALTERANALVALEQSAGFWDIKFPTDHSGTANRLQLPATPARDD
jgi:cobalt-zinc-cadmium efflux system outer membrane protein